jgi:hypothetical protein
MNLLVIGDSFCHGIGLESVFRNPANTDQAFGRYIADAMNMTYHNLAEPGSGIERAIDVGYRLLLQDGVILTELACTDHSPACKFFPALLC